MQIRPLSTLTSPLKPQPRFGARSRGDVPGPIRDRLQGLFQRESLPAETSHEPAFPSPAEVDSQIKAATLRSTEHDFFETLHQNALATYNRGHLDWAVHRLTDQSAFETQDLQKYPALYNLALVLQLKHAVEGSPPHGALPKETHVYLASALGRLSRDRPQDPALKINAAGATIVLNDGKLLPATLAHYLPAISTLMQQLGQAGDTDKVGQLQAATTQLKNKQYPEAYRTISFLLENVARSSHPRLQVISIRPTRESLEAVPFVVQTCLWFKRPPAPHDT